MCLCIRIATNALGNALGDSLVEAMTPTPDSRYSLAGSGAKFGEGKGPVRLGTGDTGDGLLSSGDLPDGGDGALRVNGLTFSQDAALRQLTNNPDGIPTMLMRSGAGKSLSTNDGPVIRDFDPENQWDPDGLVSVGADGSPTAQAPKTDGMFRGGPNSAPQSASEPSLTADDWNGQGRTLSKQAQQLADAAEWARNNGMTAAANEYQRAANKAYYDGQRALLRALDMNSERQAAVEIAKPSNPFADGWNTGDYAAGLAGVSPPAKWQPVLGKETPRASLRLMGFAADYDLRQNTPTYVGLQVGGPSFKIVDTYSVGYVSDEATPMVKISYSAGFFTGGEVSLAVGLNGIKLSGSLGGGYFGKVTGKFPQQQVQFGGGLSASIGWGKQ